MRTCCVLILLYMLRDSWFGFMVPGACFLTVCSWSGVGGLENLLYLYILYKCNPLRVINSYFSHMGWSHIIILFSPLDLNETPHPGLPQPTKSSYLFTWFYYCHMMELATKRQKNNVCAKIPHSFLSHPFLTSYYTTVIQITMVENP